MSGPAPRLVSPSWDAALYGRYSGERMRPALDLLNGLPQDLHPNRVIDLGCGTGEITATLKERWPKADVIGLDSAATMLANARGLSGAVTWVETDKPLGSRNSRSI